MKILLTNRELVHLGGSEIVTCEIAEELTRQGHEVIIYSPRVGGGSLDTRHLRVTVTPPSTDQFDVLWIHHNALIHTLGFKKRPGQRVIFNHMSSYIPLEWPRIAGVEMRLADKILANSQETKNKLEEVGLTGVELFQNPAPREFEGARDGSTYGLFISNHRPHELIPAIKALDIPVKMIGAGDDLTRVRGGHMSGAAFIVCNGKSVQYAMRAGVPVFLYDHFKGPGWLTPENVAEAEVYNFSGRGQPAADPMELTNWKNARPIECPDRFRLERALREVLCS